MLRGTDGAGKRVTSWERCRRFLEAGADVPVHAEKLEPSEAVLEMLL